MCSINKSKIGQMDIIMNENEVLVHDFLFSFEDFQKSILDFTKFIECYFKK